MGELISGAAPILQSDEFHAFSGGANANIPAPAGGSAATPGIAEGTKPDDATMSQMAFDKTPAKEQCTTCKKKDGKGEKEPGDVTKEDLKSMNSRDVLRTNYDATEHAAIHSEFSQEAYARGNVDLARNESLASWDGSTLSKTSAEELASRAAVSPDDITARAQADLASENANAASDAWFKSYEAEDLSGPKPGMTDIPEGSNLGRPDLREPGDEPYPGFHRPELPPHGTG